MDSACRDQGTKPRGLIYERVSSYQTGREGVLRDLILGRLYTQH